MSLHYETSKKDFVRVHTEIPVRYKFLSHSISIDDEGVFEGATSQISGTGLLLVGKIPSYSWIPGLLMQEILLGVNILLPSHDLPVKALAQVAWVEKIHKGSESCPMGLRFKEIEKEHQDTILRYVIKAQITH